MSLVKQLITKLNLKAIATEQRVSKTLHINITPQPTNPQPQPHLGLRLFLSAQQCVKNQIATS